MEKKENWNNFEIELKFEKNAATSVGAFAKIADASIMVESFEVS